MRATPSSTRWAIAAGSIGLAAWAAFGDATTGATATAEVGVVAAIAVAISFGAVGRARLDVPSRALTVALVCLVGWAALSIAWSVAGDRSWNQVGLLLASLAFLGLGLVVAAAWRERAVRAGAAALAVLAAVLVGWALLGVAVPSLFPDGDRSARLREPFGHAPPLALVAGVAIPLAGGLLRGAVPARVAGTLLGYGAVVALLLTQSRAGVIAAIAVVVLWAVLAGEPVLRLLRLLPSLVPGLVVAIVAFTQSALVEDGSARSDRVDAGIVFAVVAVAGALVALALELRLPVERLVRSRPRAALRATLGVAAAGAVAVAIALAAGDGFSEGECANDPSRLAGACANNRLEWWGEAWDVFRANPGIGTGAQTFAVARTRVRETATETTQPHSVPLQLLSDLGLVGFGLGLVAAIAGALALRSALRRLEGEERQAAAVLVTLPAAFVVHSIFDYDAEFLGITAPVLLAVGVLVGAGRPVARLSRAALPLAAGAVVAVAASLMPPYLASRAIDDAYEASAAGRAERALEDARWARDLDPLSLRALYAEADVAADDVTALAALEEATRLQPENADTWYQLGLYRYEFAAERDACGAYFALNRSYTLDPVSRRWETGGVLDRARDDVNKGACEAG